MKTRKTILFGVTFLIGAAMGISLFAIYSFRKPAPEPIPNPNPALVTITVEEANRLFHNYYDRADSIKAKFKGFYLDRNQLEALNALSLDKSLAGFRLYLGKTDQGEKLGIVVGVKSDMSDATTITARIYKAESRQSDPCPPSCDVNSQITR